MQYERILQQHGLLPPETDTSPPTEESPSEPVLTTSRPWTAELKAARPGMLLAGEGKSRYLDGDIWENFGGHDAHI